MPVVERRATDDRRLDDELAGLDALELNGRSRIAWGRRLWSAGWPKVAAVALFFLLWQLVVWSGWKPTYVLPPPRAVLEELGAGLADGTILDATATTLRRAAVGFALAVVIGGLVGAVVARSRVLRAAVGSMITGLMTMPSISWFPLAILLFKISEQAITFVVVLGAAPAIANGLIAGADQVPPLLVRAGRVLGARGIRLYRFVLLPASLPAFVSGLKQGWAFAWRSLLAGELLVIIAQKPSIGTQLEFSRQLNDAEGLIATMLVILVIGIIVDSLLFGTVERALRRRRGLLEAS